MLNGRFRMTDCLKSCESHVGNKNTPPNVCAHAEQNLPERKIYILVKRRVRNNQFFSQILVTDGLGIAFSIPVRCTSAGGLLLFFSSPPTPRGNGEREDGERSNSVVRQPESCSN